MDFKHFTAGKDDDGRRLDKIIRRFLDENALSSIYKSLRKGLVKVNGKKRSAEFKVSENDDIEIAEFLIQKSREQNQQNQQNQKGETNPEKAKKQKLDEKIVVFRNESILFLNKPYDIPVQPATNFSGKSLGELVEDDYEISGRKNASISFRTGPLHRLDRKTTGLIAFSQSLEGARIFSRLMQVHKIKKTYLGIVDGKIEGAQTWNDKIKKDSESESRKNDFHTVNVLDNGSDDGKISITTAIPLFYGKIGERNVTLVQFIIETGRTHQIRAQSKKHGHPLAGDSAYGSQKISGFGRDFFLHAFRIEFSESDKSELEKIALPTLIQADIDENFKKILKKIGLNDDINDNNFVKTLIK
ncbi:MAG: RluA family pseudouridine synthase [Treponema sp.]|nr:RluA family pseudouridine synthase [Treponema sp.]